MAANSKIEWTDHTFNPWVGCTKVSPACDHCYAEGWAKRAGKAAGVTWGGERRRTSDATWRQPLKWNRQAEAEGRRYRVFCASLADVFDNQVPAQWRISLMRLIVDTPHLDWLLLTKRIGNAAEMLEQAFRAVHHGREGWVDNVAPNVWLGATVCNQAEADRDVPKLLATPAAVRFLSVEPMLGQIDLKRWLPSRRFYTARCNGCGRVSTSEELGACDDDCWCVHCFSHDISDIDGIDWVICGGESGPGARPMHPDWPRSLRDQCAAASVPFLFKQWGEWAPGSGFDLKPRGYVDHAGRWVNVEAREDFPPGATSADRWAAVHRAGKKAAGRSLDCRTHDEVPHA